MFSQPFIRSTAIWRNAAGYLPFRLFATRSSFHCKVCHFSSDFRNLSHFILDFDSFEAYR